MDITHFNQVLTWIIQITFCISIFISAIALIIKPKRREDRELVLDILKSSSSILIISVILKIIIYIILGGEI